MCTVMPVLDPKFLEKGDIVLGKVNGNEYLHLIKAVRVPVFKLAIIVGELTVGSDTIPSLENVLKSKTRSILCRSQLSKA